MIRVKSRGVQGAVAALQACDAPAWETTISGCKRPRAPIPLAVQVRTTRSHCLGGAGLVGLARFPKREEDARCLDAVFALPDVFSRTRRPEGRLAHQDRPVRRRPFPGARDPKVPSTFPRFPVLRPTPEGHRIPPVRRQGRCSAPTDPNAWSLPQVLDPETNFPVPPRDAHPFASSPAAHVSGSFRCGLLSLSRPAGVAPCGRETVSNGARVAQARSSAAWKFLVEESVDHPVEKGDSAGRGKGLRRARRRGRFSAPAKGKTRVTPRTHRVHTPYIRAQPPVLDPDQAAPARRVVS